MKLIVGLGNPGRAYAGTRHSIGSCVVKALARQSRIVFKKDRANLCETAHGFIDAEEAILAIPLTYMNLSGEAVSSLVKKHRIKLEDLLVVCDDLDLELGRLRVKRDGSSAGHRGVASIIESLGSNEFIRLRIGIGRPGERGEEKDFVLSHFTAAEGERLKKCILRAEACCLMFISEGLKKTMEKFNTRELI